MRTHSYLARTTAQKLRLAYPFPGSKQGTEKAGEISKGAPVGSPKRLLEWPSRVNGAGKVGDENGGNSQNRKAFRDT